MAKVVTVSISTVPGAQAMWACANGVSIVLLGAGGDRWATEGSGGVTVERQFSVVGESYPPEGAAVAAVVSHGEGVQV